MLRLVLVCALSGCTIIGAVAGGQSASGHNRAREKKLQRGEPAPPDRSIVAWSIAGGLVGVAVDVALFFLIAPRINPSS